LELFTPAIGCDTTEVYKTFKKHLLDEITPSSFTGWEKLDSRRLLETIADPVVLNDLYAAALIAYPELGEVPQAKEGWFFSGSGSTFFKIKN
jgi:4-diphosphocytidyl-2-C-methyl-D-erythritol kinase